jgi:hypothetical protein
MFPRRYQCRPTKNNTKRPPFGPARPPDHLPFQATTTPSRSAPSRSNKSRDWQSIMHPPQQILDLQKRDSAPQPTAKPPSRFRALNIDSRSTHPRPRQVQENGERRKGAVGEARIDFTSAHLRTSCRFVGAPSTPE